MTSKLLILTFLLGFFTAWSSPHGEPLSLQGVIYQEEGSVIKGAEVIVEENGQLIHSVLSDYQGRFRLQLDNLNLSRVNIKILKKGYRAESLLPVSCKKELLHIELKSKEPEVVPVFHQKVSNRSLSI